MPFGTTQPLTAAADIMSRLVGVWYDCTQVAFGMAELGGGATPAIQLRSDGLYQAYTHEPNGGTSLATFDAPNAPSSTTGAYEVVDGSAKFGPGTFALQLHPSGSGAIYEGQVTLTTNPQELHFLSNGLEEVFTPAIAWSPRKGVCTCMNTSANPALEDDAVRLESAIAGKWMWCDGPGPFAGNMGIELGTDASWYALNEDDQGNVVRSTALYQHGIFSIVPSSETRTSGPLPLALRLNGGMNGPQDAQLLFFPKPRALLLAWFLSYSGKAGDTGTNDYQVLLPTP
jgi:hypothetical protein